MFLSRTDDTDHFTLKVNKIKLLKVTKTANVILMFFLSVTMVGIATMIHENWVLPVLFLGTSLAGVLSAEFFRSSRCFILLPLAINLLIGMIVSYECITQTVFIQPYIRQMIEAIRFTWGMLAGNFILSVLTGTIYKKIRRLKGTNSELTV